MSVTITLTPTAQMTATLAKLRNLPEVAVGAVVRGMAVASAVVLGNAVRFRFTGKGPFPAGENRLGVRTNLLRKSMQFTPPIVSGKTVTVRFGSNTREGIAPVKYFGIHEFGFSGAVQVRSHTRKAVASGGRTNKGKITRDEINKRKNILVQGRGNYSYVKPHTRNLTIAARAPLGTELRSERTQQAYFTEIGKQLRLALKTEGGPA